MELEEVGLDSPDDPLDRRVVGVDHESHDACPTAREFGELGGHLGR